MDGEPGRLQSMGSQIVRQNLVTKPPPPWIVWELPRWLCGKKSACSANAGDTGDVGLIPGSGRSIRVGNGNPLQYSCLENSLGKESWWVTVCGVTKNQSWLSIHTHRWLIFISFWYTAKWLRYTHIFHVLSYYDLLQGIEYTSLCYMIGPCLSILVKKSQSNPPLPFPQTTTS